VPGRAGRVIGMLDFCCRGWSPNGDLESQPYLEISEAVPAAFSSKPVLIAVLLDRNSPDHGGVRNSLRRFRRGGSTEGLQRDS
jgi:hypothetical protein